MRRHIAARVTYLAGGLLVVTAAMAGCSKPAPKPAGNAFETPEAAVHALADAANKSDLASILAIFGPEGRELIDTSEPEQARQNRQVFVVAMSEAWHLEDQGQAKVLVVGNEAWPFPVPLVKDGSGWRFDTAAGKEEVLARRIGRNELAVVRICRGFVAAQRKYASNGHDTNPKGVYAVTLRSDPGRQNGLYWPAKAGQPRSPIGDLMPDAEQRASDSGIAGTPYQGYYFRILTGQGASADGGARDYMVNGRLSGGFAMIAWPAHYDATGVTTFIVNQDGVVREKDLGPDTEAAAQNLHVYDPDSSWTVVN